MKKTKLTRSLLAAVSVVALSAVMYGCVHNGGDDPEPMVEPMPDPMAPVDVTMNVALGAAEMGALLEALPDAGTSDSFTIPAGGTATRATVVFTCDSDYPCTVTVTNSLDTIVASVTTQKLPDADDPMATAMIPPPMDPLHPRYTLNAPNGMSVQGIINVAIESAGDATADPPVPAGARGNPSTAIGGLDIDGFGKYDMSETTLTSDLDPNVGNYDSTGATPEARMGATLETARDRQTLYADMTALADFEHSQVLFADWGDSKTPERDGGYETAALLYSNLEMPTTEPFDTTLAAKVANVPEWFTFVAADAAVDFDDNAETDAVRVVNVADDATAAQRAGMKITVEAPQISTLATTVAGSSRHVGTYFGAPVTLKCTTAAGCGIGRGEVGDEAFTVTSGAWQILPDEGAMIMVPDQDFMVFGAWLTVPDDMAGEHRMGVFYDGMREYTATDVDRLTGKATYEGGAAGVYNDQGTAGMFTARAVLEADFGAADAAGTLSGRIDNFMNSAGVFLGSDTVATPNDPATGGENDWVVTLDSSAIADGGVAATSTISGSADGVAWATGGTWSARFYGATGTADAPVAPSSVAGQFRAMSAERGVVGAFGAERD